MKVKEGTVQKLRKSLSSIRDMLGQDSGDKSQIQKVNLDIIKELSHEADDVPSVETKDIAIECKIEPDFKIVEKIVEVVKEKSTSIKSTSSRKNSSSSRRHLSSRELKVESRQSSTKTRKLSNVTHI